MENIEKKLLDLLKTIKGNGSFSTSGVKNFILPGLHINRIGEIGFPLSPLQAKDIIKVSHKAPFGKGSQTITDSAVRSAWEINADQLSFHHENWKPFLKNVLEDTKKGLGIEEGTVTASPYKLLIYETGDFFLPHKDSEKEPGMFGTLVIGLPSAHTGGELVIHFDGREEIVDFAPSASHYKMPYVAFFADCDHEIKPLTSGYRVCLVYNLLYATEAQKPKSPQFMSQVNEMAALLTTMADSVTDKPKVVVLGHQYTPTNFSLEGLKLHDKPRAEALLNAAGKAGYFARLGLVTHYLMGDMEGGDYDDYNYGYSGRSRKYGREPQAAEMGEVYESDTRIEHWSSGGGPGLGKISVSEEDLITDIEVGDGDPIDKAEEGYTGNAGMTIEYWYHYGAVVLWPTSKHLALLSACTVSVRLEWLDYYLQYWEKPTLQFPESAKQLLMGFQVPEIEENGDEDWDFDPVVAVLLKLNDKKFLADNCAGLLTKTFDLISVKAWTDLLQGYPPDIFVPIFKKAGETNNVFRVNHLLKILEALEALNAPSYRAFLSHQIQHIPVYIEKIEFSQLKDGSYYYLETEEKSRKKTITAVLGKILSFSRQKNEDAKWIKSAFDVVVRVLPRKYVNDVLAAVLLGQKDKNNALAKALHAVCVHELLNRTAVKPTPPPNWAREVPKSENYYKEIWEILRPFLISPTQQVFEYRKSESYRKQMENAIDSVTIDLKMETIKKGSPHTLQLTKTQAAYEKALKKWKEDVALLEALNGL